MFPSFVCNICIYNCIVYKAHHLLNIINIKKYPSSTSMGCVCPFSVLKKVVTQKVLLNIIFTSEKTDTHVPVFLIFLLR